MDFCDEAVEIAARRLEKKEEKLQKKLSLSQKQQTKHENCTSKCDSNNNMKLKVEEGKDSTIIKSPLTNRKFERREGVAEKNDTERKLVKESVKVMARTTYLNDYNLL